VQAFYCFYLSLVLLDHDWVFTLCDAIPQEFYENLQMLKDLAKQDDVLFILMLNEEELLLI